MAWDFSTDPEFQEQLDWMREFVREEIWPLETLVDELDQDQLDRVYAPLQERGQGARAVGRAPRPRARRAGLRPGQARPDARDPRHARRTRRSRSATRRRTRATREILALAGTREQKERWLEPLLAGDLQVGLLDDRARTRGLGPDDAADARRARRRRLGHQRPQVVLVQRVDRRLPHRHGGHRPRRAPAPARVDVHRPGRHARREHPARRPDDGAPAGGVRQARRPRRDPLRGRARPGGEPARRRGRGLPHRPAPPGPGPHPPLHALARRGAAAPSTCSASARPTARRAAGRWPTSRRPELDRRLGRRRCRPRG